ncbi:unnamed protein product [Adineta ricciae]|uniref:Transcriptional initiation protein Tat n=1 Tax=Adineta ricciae TaxID=249248 RepID=A0A815V7I5_ADIRI|nr:unnamed protein product [Adineta ricciae]CAF1531044.1 unnamed protein product [Adineta ricciae]
MSIQVVQRVQIPSGAASTTYYIQNRAPLQPVPFQKLPPGAVKANGWLLGQLKLQINGLNGKLYEISDYLNYDNCGWIDPTKTAWEEMPYWLRGFAELGFVTGDPDVLAITKRWMDGVLSTQQPDGWFGPNYMRTSLDGVPDLWPAMLFSNMFRSLYEYTNDARVIPFLLKWFQFVAKAPDDSFNRGWGATRWAEDLANIIWLYNRTTDSDWLLDLMNRIHKITVDWVYTTPTLHNVNFAQGFREPAFYSLVVNPPNPALVQVTYDRYQELVYQFGQFPGGGVAGDEGCRYGYTDPRQGLETCGFAEFMHSFQMLMRVTGDGYWIDRCETIGFNSFPAAFDPFVARGTHYITCVNSIQLDDQTKSAFADNWFPLLAYKPGVHQYRCCPHNYGIGWPYYTEEAWLATYDGGLCASLYVPCQVTAFVGVNTETPITIIEETNYPFDENIQFHLQLSTPTQFKLYLRIPDWCNKPPTVTINGRIVFNQKTPDNGSFIIINRVWTNDDIVKLTLPLELTTKTWKNNKNSVSIHYGPLAFSLAINEQYNRIGGTNEWPEYEVIAKSNWNYGLLLSSSNEWKIKRKTRKNNSENIFTQENIPLNIEARARRIPEWIADQENVVGILPQSPVQSKETDESVTLIPMGAARLRITAFPTIAQ